MKYPYLLLLALLAGCVGKPEVPGGLLLRSSDEL